MSIKSELEISNKIARDIENRIKKDLLKRYRETNKELKLMFGNLYEKYAVKDVLTFQEMQKFNRLKTVQKDIAKAINDMYIKDKAILHQGLKKTYKSGYYRLGYAIEKDLGSKLSYRLLDVKKIEKAIQNPVSGLTLNETLIKNKTSIISKINQEITQGLVRGESYGKMAKRITETLGGDASKAVRVAQTEAHRVHEQANLESAEHAEDMGISMKKIWTATLDDATRDAHQELDGETIGMDEDFTSSAGGRGPGPGQMGNAADDINCRCTLTYEVDEIAHEQRVSRDEGIIKNQTYEEWAAAKEIKVS